MIEMVNVITENNYLKNKLLIAVSKLNKCKCNKLNDVEYELINAVKEINKLSEENELAKLLLAELYETASKEHRIAIKEFINSEQL